MTTTGGNESIASVTSSISSTSPSRFVISIDLGSSRLRAAVIVLEGAFAGQVEIVEYDSESLLLFSFPIQIHRQLIGLV